MTRVLVTRQAKPQGASGDSGEALVAALASAGLEAVSLPLIETVPLRDTTAIDRALDALPTYDWVVLASASAARLCVGGARRRKVGLAGLARPRVCAGPATAAVLTELGWRADLVVAPFSAERARDALLPLVGEGTRVLLPRAASGRDVIAPALRGRGARVDEIALYETVASPAAAEIVGRLAAREFRAVLLFSPSAVAALSEAAAGTGILNGVTVACIGPTTAAAAAAAGWPVDVVAPDTTAPALAAALAAHLDGRLVGVAT